MGKLPDKDELVIAVIKKILPYGAFCSLPEYENLEAFLHVSEVAPRWIKNIHEFISEGGRHVVKVHHIDPEKNQVDVSIKRVSDQEKKAKTEQMRTEKRAEKLIELSIKDSKLKIKPEDFVPKLEEKFGDLYSAFVAASEQGEKAFKAVDIPPALKTSILEIAKKNIKQQSVTIHRIIKICCYGANGVEEIKKVLPIKDKTIDISYLGAPKYRVSLSALNYKEAEKKFDMILEQIKTLAQKSDCVLTYEPDAL